MKGICDEGRWGVVHEVVGLISPKHLLSSHLAKLKKKWVVSTSALNSLWMVLCGYFHLSYLPFLPTHNHSTFFTIPSYFYFLGLPVNSSTLTVESLILELFMSFFLEVRSLPNRCRLVRLKEGWGRGVCKCVRVGWGGDGRRNNVPLLRAIVFHPLCCKNRLTTPH